MEVANHEEILINDEVRVLAIDLRGNTDLVQITGTQIVPEISMILLPALSASTIGIVMAFNWFRK